MLQKSVDEKQVVVVPQYLLSCGASLASSLSSPNTSFDVAIVSTSMGCCNSRDAYEEVASFERTEPLLDFDCKVGTQRGIDGLCNIPGWFARFVERTLLNPLEAPSPTIWHTPGFSRKETGEGRWGVRPRAEPACYQCWRR